MSSVGSSRGRRAVIGLLASVWMVAGFQLATAPSAPASATTLTVCSSGCQYTTIADALAAATDGDTVSIGAGTYAGGFTIDKSLSVIGAGASQTTISGGAPQCQQCAPTVVSINGGISVTISSVTITGGAIGVVSNRGTLTVEDSTISDNGPGSGAGGGITNNGGTLTVEDSTIVENAGKAAGGIFNHQDGTATITRSTISGNSANDGVGGITNGCDDPADAGGTLTVEDSTISDSTGPSGGSHGFGLLNCGQATVAGSTISGNSDGGVANPGTLSVDHSTISGNGNAASGSAVSGGIANSGKLAVENSTISGNTATAGGGIHNAGALTLDHTKVMKNTASESGGGIYNSAGTVSLSYSQVIENTADSDGGGIYDTAGGTITLTHSPVEANKPDNCVGCR